MAGITAEGGDRRSRVVRASFAITTTVVLLLVQISVARAESMETALEQFGLIGTWSNDCAKSPEKDQNIARFTFAVPRLFGPDTLKITTSGGGKFSKINYKIVAAQRITNDKIRIKFATDDPAYDDPAPGSPEQLITKNGDRLQWLFLLSIGSRLERCLN